MRSACPGLTWHPSVSGMRPPPNMLKWGSLKVPGLALMPNPRPSATLNW